MKPTSRIPRHVSLCALALAALGCAHAPATPVAAATEEAGTKKMVVTGSRLPQVVDAQTGLPATTSPVRIYSREQLQAAGQEDLGPALRSLDPGLR